MIYFSVIVIIFILKLHLIKMMIGQNNEHIFYLLTYINFRSFVILVLFVSVVGESKVVMG